MSDKTCKVILWCDIETTGDEWGRDEIIEVAFLVTSASGRPCFTQDGVDYTNVFAPSSMELMERIPLVRKMHEASGLLAEVEGEHALPQRALHTLADEVASLVAACGEDRQRVYLGGRNPDFERRFLERYAPGVLDIISYRNVDITSCEAMAMGTEWEQAQDETPLHRAVPDVLREVRRYRAIKRGLIS